MSVMLEGKAAQEAISNYAANLTRKQFVRQHLPRFNAKLHPRMNKDSMWSLPYYFSDIEFETEEDRTAFVMMAYLRRPKWP